MKSVTHTWALWEVQNRTLNRCNTRTSQNGKINCLNLRNGKPERNTGRDRKSPTISISSFLSKNNLKINTTSLVPKYLRCRCLLIWCSESKRSREEKERVQRK